MEPHDDVHGAVVREDDLYLEVLSGAPIVLLERTNGLDTEEIVELPRRRRPEILCGVRYSGI